MDNNPMSIEEIKGSKCDDFWIRHLLTDPETWPKEPAQIEQPAPTEPRSEADLVEENARLLGHLEAANQRFMVLLAAVNKANETNERLIELLRTKFACHRCGGDR